MIIIGSCSFLLLFLLLLETLIKDERQIKDKYNANTQYTQIQKYQTHNHDNIPIQKDKYSFPSSFPTQFWL